MIDIFGNTDPVKTPSHLFYGAIEIRYQTAVRADVRRQNYSVCPRHWFIDAVFRCLDCKRPFEFTAREQRFWYERRGFYVDSKPTRCPKCRRFQRTKLRLRKHYDSIIAEALPKTASDQRKKEALVVIDALAAASDSLSEKIRRNRRTLSEQLRKRAEVRSRNP